MMWPYFSKKYIQLSIIWSCTIHLLLFFVVSSPFENTHKTHKISSLSVQIENIKQDKTQPSIDNTPVQTEDESIAIIDQNSSQIATPSLLKKSLPEKNIFDTPPEPINELVLNDIESTSDTINWEQPLIVIKIWIDETGIITSTEVLNTQLDDQTTKKMAVKIGGQLFKPAIKNGKGISSTKTYIINSLSYE